MSIPPRQIGSASSEESKLLYQILKKLDQIHTYGIPVVIYTTSTTTTTV